MPAFPLQLVDRGKLLSVIQEQNVFPNDPALSLLLRAICGKVNGILDKLAHLILQKGNAFQCVQFSFYAQAPENARTSLVQRGMSLTGARISNEE